MTFAASRERRICGFRLTSGYFVARRVGRRRLQVSLRHSLEHDALHVHRTAAGCRSSIPPVLLYPEFESGERNRDVFLPRPRKPPTPTMSATTRP